jgi:hypothetical protein
MKMASVDHSWGRLGAPTLRTLSNKMRWSSVVVMRGCGKGSLASTFFAASEGRLSARVPVAGRGIGCGVELTEVTAPDGTWWTLGFEATGPPDELPSLVEATAALMFQQPLPADLELSAADCGSYHGWLRNRLGAAEPATRRDDHAAPRPHE